MSSHDTSCIWCRNFVEKVSISNCAAAFHFFMAGPLFCRNRSWSRKRDLVVEFSVVFCIFFFTLYRTYLPHTFFRCGCGGVLMAIEGFRTIFSNEIVNKPQKKGKHVGGGWWRPRKYFTSCPSCRNFMERTTLNGAAKSCIHIPVHVLGGPACIDVLSTWSTLKKHREFRGLALCSTGPTGWTWNGHLKPHYASRE